MSRLLPTQRLAVARRRRALAVACAAALACCATAHAASEPPRDTATPAALADLGLAMLRQPGGANAVVSPLAAATALGMVQAGTSGAAEREIEALFGPRQAGSVKQRLPALLQLVRGSVPSASSPSSSAPLSSQASSPHSSRPSSPFVLAGRVWINQDVAGQVPAGFTQRLAARYGADALRLPFTNPETARGQVNAWTAAHTAGRINSLLPPGSVGAGTQLVLTAAVHFRSPWDQPFDATLTAPRGFASPSGATQVPTLLDERSVLQASVGGTQLYAVPFAGQTYALLLALPAAGSTVAALLQATRGSDIAGWQAALQPQRCALALPKFDFQPQAAGLKPVLQQLGVKTVFTSAADLRPMLGRSARGTHLDDVHQAAGITIDEQGGEAVAAAAATVQAKSLALPPPPCAIDRPFVFAVLHLATGTPLFMGRVAEPGALH